MININKIRQIVSSAIQSQVTSRSIVINHYTLTENEFNESEKQFVSQDIVEATVLDYVQYSPKFDSIGAYSNASFILLLPHDIDISEYDTIEFDNKEFGIITIKPHYLGEYLLAKTVFLKSQE